MNNSRKPDFSSIVEKLAEERTTNVSTDTFQTEIEIWRAETEKDTVSSTLEVGAGAGVFSAFLILSDFADQAVTLDPLVEAEGPANIASDIREDLRSFDKIENNLTHINGWYPDDIPSDTFDMIIFRKALHHIYSNPPDDQADVVTGLSNAKEHLEPGGWVYIMETIYPPRWFQLLFNFYRWTRGLSSRGWSNKRHPDQWINCLKEAGFKNVQVSKTPLNIALGSKIMERGSLFISHRRLITGQKPK